MSKKIGISVALASYNGEKYIEKQLQSIIKNLSPSDEIVISDDGSTDQTIEIIEKVNRKTNIKIRLLEGLNKGVFRNFENAILNCQNEIVFLSDQDDVWLDNKKDEVLRIFEKFENISVVLHNAIVILGDIDNPNSASKMIKFYRKGVLANLINSSYWGCCMAFRKAFIEGYLPFACETTAHDQLIGLIGEANNATYFLDKVLINHRIHGTNQTSKLSFIESIRFRINLLKAFQKCDSKVRITSHENNSH